jgi:predicted alpha/beta-fold hydrolase
MLAVLPGCLAERSFPMVPERLARLKPDGGRVPARAWARAMHAAARDRLPDQSRDALTTDDLTGAPAQVWRHFALDPARLDSLWGNWDGIEKTALVASPPPQIESGHIQRAAWKGFEDVELPGVGGAMLFARLGRPQPAHAMPGSAIIITHGLFGTLDGIDMENQAQALRRAGHTVLALEMRGHGETNCRHPEYAITFGMYEVGDLAAAAGWLKTQVAATRVGLVSFSLTAYEALLLGWLDGQAPVTELNGYPALAQLPKPGPEPVFNAGMLVISPPVGILSLADGFTPKAEPLNAPCRATFQGHVVARLEAYGEPPAYGMWDLAKSEFTRAGFLTPGGDTAVFRESFYRFIDLSRDSWRVGAARMENVRVPLLVLHAADDPLGTAQGVADLFGRVRNPNVGVIILRQGGHMGFSALSADYYYSVITNFFDPATAPATVSPVAGIVRRNVP